MGTINVLRVYFGKAAFSNNSFLQEPYNLFSLQTESEKMFEIYINKHLYIKY